MDGLHPILHLAGTVLIHWAALVGVASVIIHTRVRWWATEMGRHLMAYMSIIAATLVLSCFVNDFGDSAWFQLVRLVVFIGVPIVMTQRLALQLKVRRTVQPPVEPTSSDDHGRS